MLNDSFGWYHGNVSTHPQDPLRNAYSLYDAYCIDVQPQPHYCHAGGIV